MSNLVVFVVFYLLVSIAIGLIAATRVHNSRDFAVAGRHLPLPIVTATVFATWFGAETVLGISATFVKDGLGAVVADPFGSSLCLIIAGLFFASRLYRMNLLTIGDYYRVRYNRGVEVLCTLAIVASYLGWVAAQIKALGLVFNVITDGAVSQPLGMVIGAAVGTHLHDAGRHAVRGRARFRADDGDHGRHAVHRLGDLGAHRRRRRRGHARLRSGQARFFPGSEARRLDSFHRRVDHHDAGLHSAAGRVPAHHLGQG